jgi:Raf kinase inhibitor-like YbhB/YbcL family protein
LQAELDSGAREEDDLEEDGAMNRVLAIAIIMGIRSAVYAADKEAAVAQFTLSSSSFRNNQPMPAKFSCEGEDASPALKWEGAPAGTKSFALIADDPDAPGGTWVHWMAYAIPATTTGLPESVARTDVVAALGGLKQGMNDFGRVGYGGPCPPRGHGVHHYHFRLYALDAELNLAARVTRKQLDAAMKGHILAQTELVGTYQRD